jgi:predicted nucleic acid-binding protein
VWAFGLTFRGIHVKPTVYIETSVISYRTARPSRDLIVAAHQQMTHEWWERVLPQCDAFVSPVVLEEIAHGDPDAAQRRQQSVATFPVVEVVPEVHALAAAYFATIPLPDKAQADAYHLALAAWHGLDYLVSWNCTHIVSGRVRMIVEEVNAEFGIRTPIICTPEELMEVA